MRVPLADVLAWPDHHVRLQLAFLEREPPADDRIEFALAQLSALTFNLQRGKDSKPLGASDFLAFADPWKQPEQVGVLGSDEVKMMGHLRSRPTT